MKAFSIKNTAKIHVYKEPVTMIYSFTGLSEKINKAGLKVDSGDLFLFVNRAKNYVKVLYYHGEGICILSKKLPKGIFDVAVGSKMTLTELQNLIDRVIIHGGKKLPHLKVAGEK